MIALARLGEILTILGVAGVALFGIRGILGVVGIMPTYSDPAVVGFGSMILLGTGAAVIGPGAQGVLAATAPRSGLFLFAVGCFSIVSIGLMAAQEVVPGSLGVGSGVIIFAGFGLLAPIGLLLTGASLVRSGGTPTIVGLLICVGGALAILGLFSSSVLGYDMSRAILLLGASMVGAGLMGVGLIAGRRPSRADGSRAQDA